MSAKTNRLRVGERTPFHQKLKGKMVKRLITDGTMGMLEAARLYTGTGGIPALRSSIKDLERRHGIKVHMEQRSGEIHMDESQIARASSLLHEQKPTVAGVTSDGETVTPAQAKAKLDHALGRRGATVKKEMPTKVETEKKKVSPFLVGIIIGVIIGCLWILTH